VRCECEWFEVRGAWGVRFVTKNIVWRLCMPVLNYACCAEQGTAVQMECQGFFFL
jgi:hypothetical protein